MIILALSPRHIVCTLSFATLLLITVAFYASLSIKGLSSQLNNGAVSVGESRDCSEFRRVSDNNRTEGTKWCKRFTRFRGRISETALHRDCIISYNCTILSDCNSLSET